MPPLHPGQATGSYLTPALAQVKTLTRPSQIPHPAAPPSPVRREKGISHRLGEGQGTARAWASTAMSIFGSRFVLKPDSQGFSTLKNGFLNLKWHFSISPNHFAISRNRFVISRKRFAISPKHFSISPNRFAISRNHFAISPKSFSMSRNGFAISRNHFKMSRNDFAISGNEGLKLGNHRLLPVCGGFWLVLAQPGGLPPRDGSQPDARTKIISRYYCNRSQRCKNFATASVRVRTCSFS